MKSASVITAGTLTIALFLSHLASCQLPKPLIDDLQCPIFKCSPDNRLDGMDLCFKSDLIEPRFIHLKKCSDGKMCHGKINRCMDDPYNVFEGKLPGQLCEFDFQCLSKKCALPKSNGDLPNLEARGVCSGQLEKKSCSSDSQCDTGLYCSTDSQVCEKQKID